MNTSSIAFIASVIISLVSIILFLFFDFPLLFVFFFLPGIFLFKPNEKTEELLFCPQCGARLEKNWRYCPFCSFDFKKNL